MNTRNVAVGSPLTGDIGPRQYRVNFAPMHFVKFAESCGATGIHIDNPSVCATQLERAFDPPGPVIIECVVDPHELPIPAKVKKNQVSKLTDALRAGTPNRNRIALQMVKDMLDESSFDASPGHVLPGGPVGRAAKKVTEKLLEHTHEEQPTQDID